MRRFAEFLEAKELSCCALEPVHLDQFAQHIRSTVRNRHNQPIGLARVHRHLNSVGLFLRYLFEQQRMLQDLSLHIKAPVPSSKLPFVPSYRQVMRLLELPDIETPLGLRDRALLETAYGCGLRLSELQRLTIYDFDLEAGTLVVVKGKGGAGRYLPLGRWAGYYLEFYLSEARQQLVKERPYRELWLDRYGKPLRKQALQYRFSTFQSKLDFPLSSHTLRHAFATHLLEGGANLRLVQQMLGHRLLRTTERYTRVRPVALKTVHRRAHPRG